MALSKITYTGNGVTTQYPIPFALGYIKQSDVTCRVNNEVDGLGSPIYRALVFNSPTLVTIQGAVPANGVPIVFDRSVEREELIIDFEDGDIITEDNLNTAQKQAIMLVHEALDGKFGVLAQSLNAGGFRITNLAAGVAPTDAVNLQQLANIVAGVPVSFVVQDGVYGNITVSGGGTVWTIAPAVVTETNIVNTATDALRVTISNLAYPKGLDRSGTIGAAAANTAAIIAAMTKKYVELGDGDIAITSIPITATHRKLIGHGKRATNLIATVNGSPAIDILTGLAYIDIENMTISRNGTPINTGSGIKTGASVNLMNFNDLEITGHWDGMNLFNTGYSHIRRGFIHNNLSDGIEMQNSGADNQLQWYLSDILFQTNGERGIYAHSNAGPAAVALGDWLDIKSFANTGPAVAVVGSVGVPVNGVRMRGGFLGEDNASEIYLDTYGFGHKIENMFLEIAGTRSTGPGFGTPASGTGYGAQVTANNLDVKFADCYVYGNSSGGLSLSASVMNRVTDTTVRSHAGNGIVFADGSKSAVTDCDFASNGANIAVTSNAAALLRSGNTPAATEGTQIPGGVAVGAATGGIPTAGLINVSAGVLKNNVAYTNP